MTIGNIKFSQQPVLPLTSITSSTITPVVESSTNYQLTLGNIASYVTNSGNITATTVSTTGNITGSYFIGNGSQLTGLPALYGNTNVAAYLSSGAITGNIITTGGYFIGNGSLLTGVATSNLATYVTANAQANITSVGTLTSLSVGGNVTISGTTSLNPYIETTSTVGNTSTSFTPTMSNGPVQKITANASFTLNAPSGMSSGQSITLVIRQDATGNRIMTPNAAYKFAFGSNTLSTAANAIDTLSIFYDNTNYLCNLSNGYQ